jgi:hypothetical protein
MLRVETKLSDKSAKSQNSSGGIWVKHPLRHLAVLVAFILLSGLHPIPGSSYVYADNEAIEDQVAGIFFEESAKDKIRVVILDFTALSSDTDKELSQIELKDLGSRFTEEFIANILRKIRDAGKRDKISIIDRSKLDTILQEKKIPSTGITERTAIEIGAIAGLDVIVIGSLRVADKSFIATAKVVRVKDGEILSIAKEDRLEKPAAAQTPITILDIVETVRIGSYKALPLNLTSGGILNAAITVVRGNSLDIYIISGSELENLKNRKEFKNIADFTAMKMKSYKRSGHLAPGDYYLVLRDSSLGIFSAQSSEMKITIQLEPRRKN